MKNIIDHIKQNKIECYFISPHLDDAVLSAGSLLVELNEVTNVTLINVFTDGGSRPYTLSGRAFLKQCGYKDSQRLFIDRKNEDKKVLKDMNIQHINLNYTDALWRKKNVSPLVRFFARYIPEFAAVYPTYKFHLLKGKIADADKEMMARITKDLHYIVTNKNAYVFCPAGTGNHIDHIIVNKICSKLFEQVIFWSDFPYNVHEENKTENMKDKIAKMTYPFTKKKEELVRGYKTQFMAMFPNGKMPRKAEAYFVPALKGNI